MKLETFAEVIAERQQAIELAVDRTSNIRCRKWSDGKVLRQPKAGGRI
jgi:hypothetical protein